MTFRALRSFSTSCRLFFPRKRFERVPFETNNAPREPEPPVDVLEKWYPGKMSKSGKSGVLPGYHFSEISKTRRFQVKKANNVDVEEKDIVLFFDPENPQVFKRKLKALKKLNQTEKIAELLRNNLKTMSGYSKIDILEFLLEDRYPIESWIVFEKIYENGIMPRLDYSTFHKMIYLLCKEPIENRDKILETFTWMKRFGHTPTAELFSLLIKCGTKWNDYQFVYENYEKMSQLNLVITPEAFNNLLLIASTQKTKTQLKQGANIWETHKKDTEIELSAVKSILIIYGKLQDAAGIESVISTVNERFDKLLQKYNQSSKKSENSTPFELHLNNAYLAGWSLLGNFEKSLEIFKRLGDLEIAHHQTFKIMMGMAWKKRDLEMGIDLYDLCNQRNIKICHQMYQNLINLYAFHKDLLNAEKILSKALLELSLKPEQSKYQTTLAPFMSALIDCKEYERVLYEFDKIPTPRALMYRYAIEAKIQLADLEGALKLGIQLELVNGSFEPITQENIISRFDKVHNQ